MMNNTVEDGKKIFSTRLKWIRLLNKGSQLFKNPINIISVIGLLFLSYTIVIPLWEIISKSFQVSAKDMTDESGVLTLAHWIRVLGSDISQSLFYKPLLNSLSIGIGVSILSLLLGGALAWLVTMTVFHL